VDFVFLERFTPRIIHVNNRKPSFWLDYDHFLDKEKTVMNSLAYVYAGEGGLQVGDRTYELSAGIVFSFAKGEPIVLESSKTNPLCFYAFNYRYSLVTWSGEETHFVAAPQASPFPEWQQTQDRAIKEAFQSAFALWNQKQAGYRWKTNNLFLQIIEMLIEYSEKNGKDSQLANEHIRDAITYMNENYMQPLTRELLAEHVALSPGYFSVAFKRVTGQSPIQYLNSIRIDKAKSLLTRAFTSYVGMPPRDFRNG
jgi:AraC-like DNA-binding protein